VKPVGENNVSASPGLGADLGNSDLTDKVITQSHLLRRDAEKRSVAKVSILPVLLLG
jgi:hypothetical protein